MPARSCPPLARRLPDGTRRALSVVVAGLLAAGVLAGCSALPAGPAGSADLAPSPCDAAFARVDLAVQAAGVGDAGASRVAGFAYLRVDRFLASFRHTVKDADLPAWADALRRLDQDARGAETARLGAGTRDRLREDIAALPGCARSLLARDLAGPGRRAALRDAARVPDDYDTGLRVAGLYWLTRLPFALGVQRYHDAVQSTYATPVDALPLDGGLVRYALEDPQPAAPDILADAAARVREAGERFGPPDPDDVDRLLRAHAPQFEVDEALPADRIGTLRLDAAGRPAVDTGQASVYARLAFTRFGGRVLAQAVYTAWFPARPSTGPLDLLSGAFDALVWRVTLDERGAPLVADSMHACGCYHRFFPAPGLTPRPRPASLDEWALVPQSLPAQAAGTPLRLRVASGTHDLVRVLGGAAGADRRYQLRPDDDLRVLVGPDGGRASLFDPDGLLPGSERGERWLFWPMGIREPGAMRQWGRHATAFIGRRHFDEADLLDRYFRP